jgi:pilus assembly protein CpaE
MRPVVTIISDDPMLQHLISGLLTEEGYETQAASTAGEAMDRLREQSPALVIIDVGWSGENGMDALALCRNLREDATTSNLPVLMIAPVGDTDHLEESIAAGANEYLTRPFRSRELTALVEELLARYQPPAPARPDAPTQPQRRGRLIAIFGGQGGVGKTVMVVNLAVALHQQGAGGVALFDANFSFGGVGVHLNLTSSRSVIDLLEHLDQLEPDQDGSMLLPHPSGIHVLLSPPRPEQAELVTAEHLVSLLDYLTATYDLVLVDCSQSYDDRMLTILERANDILFVVTPEVPAIKNTSLFLGLAGHLGLPPENIHIVLNRSNSNVGLGPDEIERVLKQRFAFRMISDGRAVTSSINHGVPLIVQQPNHPLCKQIRQIADYFSPDVSTRPAAPQGRRRLVGLGR